jgi:hypothetical protein
MKLFVSACMHRCTMMQKQSLGKFKGYRENRLSSGHLHYDDNHNHLPVVSYHD